MEDLGFTYMQRIRNEIEYNYGWMFWKDHDKEMGIYFHGDQDEEESLSFIGPLGVTDILLEYLEKK